MRVNEVNVGLKRYEKIGMWAKVKQDSIPRVRQGARDWVSGWRRASQFFFYTSGQYAGKLWGPSPAPCLAPAVVPICRL